MIDVHSRQGIGDNIRDPWDVLNFCLPPLQKEAPALHFGVLGLPKPQRITMVRVNCNFVTLQKVSPMLETKLDTVSFFDVHCPTKFRRAEASAGVHDRSRHLYDVSVFVELSRRVVMILEKNCRHADDGRVACYINAPFWINFSCQTGSKGYRFL